MWNCTHFRHPTDEQLRHVDIYFLATNIICSLSTLNTLKEIEVIDYVTEKEAAYLLRKLRGTVLFDATSIQMKVMLLVCSNQWSIFCTSHTTMKSRHFNTFPIVR